MDFHVSRGSRPTSFKIIGDLKQAARRAGEDIIDSNGQSRPARRPRTWCRVDRVGRESAEPSYSVVAGSTSWRLAICRLVPRRYGVEIDPTRGDATIGSKEGIGHLSLAIPRPGDVVLCPSPTYPIHQYSVIIAGRRSALDTAGCR